MATTYEPIATTTLGSTATSITFSNIPSTYTDLRLVLNTSSNNNSGIGLRIYTDWWGGGSSYSQTAFAAYGYYTFVDRTSGSGYLKPETLSYNSNTRLLSEVDIFSYANTSVYKTFIMRTGTVSSSGSGYSPYTSATVGLWASTQAIQQLDILASWGMKSGTTATLYGIKAA